MSILKYTLERAVSNGDTVSIDGTLDYTMTPIVPATYWEPAEGGEVDKIEFHDRGGHEVELTDDEVEAALEYVYEHGEPDEPYDPYDE